jgi:hypothetical protein
MKKHVLFLLSSLTLWAAANTAPAWAEELRSNSFVIQFGNINVTSGKKDSASYNVTDTVGQVGNGAYTSSSYAVGSGFQYIYQIDDFFFQISQVAIDLGELVPNTHTTASHTLSITTRGASGYTVYAYELHPLRHSNGTATTADTTCNSGTCSESTAGVWTTPTTPGFGFNMSGNDVPADFVDTTYFRQFANIEGSESKKVVMSSTNVALNRVATVTYKAGVTNSQAAGNYQTAVVFTAVPGY